MEIKFIVPGKPVGKARPKVTRHGTFTPKKTKDYEQLVKDCWRLCGGYIAGPVTMRLKIYFSVPESYSKKKKNELFGTPHLKRPDIDNICKAIMDSLNGLAYPDDAMICSLYAEKLYGDDRVEVIIQDYQTGKKNGERI